MIPVAPRFTVGRDIEEQKSKVYRRLLQSTFDMRSPSHPPIFIVGCQRSGTTMLRLMLTAHPDVCIPPESMFFTEMADAFGEGLSQTSQIEELINRLYKNAKFREWGVDRSVLYERLVEKVSCSYGQAVSEIYQTYRHLFDSEAERWGDKNPYHIHRLPVIFRHFPNSNVVHIIRDVRGVFNSHKSRSVLKNWSHLDSNQLLKSVSDKWNECIRIHQRYLDDDRVTHLFYEDLVEDPQDVLRKICEAVDLPYSQEMLHFHEKNREEQLVPSHRREWHEKTFQPIEPDRATAWKDSLSSSEIEALEILSGDTLTHFGYDLKTTSPRLRGYLFLFSNSVSNHMSHRVTDLVNYFAEKNSSA